MFDTFKFLTQEDRNLMLEKTRRRTFKKQQMIVEQNSTLQAIYVILNGTASVQMIKEDSEIEVASLGSGEIFGEMSLIEAKPTSARIVANTRMELEVIEGPLIISLLASVPGFATRFYHSLAVILSQRLRETSEKLKS